MRLEWRQVVPALLIGLALGAGLGRWAHWRHHGGGSPERRYGRMVERFSRALDLTPDQRDRVESILETKRQRIRALRAETRPRFEEIRRSTKEEIRKVLTPEQAERFARLEEKWARMRQRRRAPFHP